MANQIEDFITYIRMITGQVVTSRPREQKSLPTYLKQGYGLYDLFVGQDRYLGVLLKESTDFRPATYEKHLAQLFKLMDDTPHGACLMAFRLPPYVRNRLVERCLSFVVPDTQLFWPELGTAVKARRWSRVPTKVEVLSPVAQAVVIYVLNQPLARYTPKVLAEKLGYSSMSMTRALNEIEANQLGVVLREGKERHLTFPDGRSILWQRALPYLRSPIREQLHLATAGINTALLFVAGESALATRSLLSPPNEPVFAIDGDTWKSIAKDIQKIPIKDEGTCLVQIWRYRPLLYTHDNQVDDFSLYLSLQHHHDERINIALDELMENKQW